MEVAGETPSLTGEFLGEAHREGQIKCFPDKVKLKEFIITKPLLYEMLKGFIYEKEEHQKYEQ